MTKANYKFKVGDKVRKKDDEHNNIYIIKSVWPSEYSVPFPYRLEGSEAWISEGCLKSASPELIPYKPYEPDWTGLFCTRDGQPVEILTTVGRGNFPIIGYIGDWKYTSVWTADGKFQISETNEEDLFCAEMSRLDYKVYILEIDGKLSTSRHTSKEAAESVVAYYTSHNKKARVITFVEEKE